MFNYFAMAEATFINIGEAEIATITGYITDLISDLMPLLTLVFGLMIAVLIIGLLIKFIGGNNTS